MQSILVSEYSSNFVLNTLCREATKCDHYAHNYPFTGAVVRIKRKTLVPGFLFNSLLSPMPVGLVLEEFVEQLAAQLTIFYSLFLTTSAPTYLTSNIELVAINIPSDHPAMTSEIQ